MLKGRQSALQAWACVAMMCVAGMAMAQQRPAPMPPGPYDVKVLEGGVGLDKPLPADAPYLQAQGDWTLQGRVRLARADAGDLLIAGVGEPEAGRFFAIDAGRLAFVQGAAAIRSRERLQPGHWHALAAVAQGNEVALYLDGRRVAQGTRAAQAVAPKLVFAPLPGTRGGAHFGGEIAGFVIAAGALSPADLQANAKVSPDPDLVRFEDASPIWPVQTRQMAGQLAPQPAATLPRSRVPFSEPKAGPLPTRPVLEALDTQRWRINGWRLASAEGLAADGAALSQPGHAAGTTTWYPATVPGTVLTTLVDRGVYPDPDYGVNNLAIPESLSRHDWWYRSEFELPQQAQGRRLELRFNGINYAGEVWVNGRHVGGTRGAFARGRFDVGPWLRPGRNAVAVRVSPPPHPGIAHEQSMSAGVGENGGMQALDGPTFIASEGWDWIPAVRDRNTGLWQDVELRASGEVAIGDAQVITAALAPDHARAELELRIPLHNAGNATRRGELSFAFDSTHVRREIEVPPGDSELRWTARDVPELAIRQPRLWWPNGYGEPALYRATLAFSSDGAVSDTRTLRFGIRQIAYELSLFDEGGQLRRVLVDLEKARQRGERIVDPRHEAIRPVPGGHAQSFYPGAERSPAVAPLQDDALSPHLALRINGVRIAAKGGNWGMDDWRKRVSRERLEPYFKLQRDAHLNVVRNWVGQNTEETFYELADEYGLLVLNDFWQSTQNYNLEPADPALFLANAEEVVRRFRNHPSIVLWFGRNEGVPAPLLNEGLADVVARLDGTRWYTGSSNEVNLQRSGPYNWREPVEYFQSLAQGFSVEVGTPSFATLESFRATVPGPDRWPIGDVWAYHDWHQSGNGDTASFMRALESKLGPARDLGDFERKAQLLNYDSHRAIFEGFNAGLWRSNSGRLLWMSHPAWPSHMWQIYSHDYDTHAAYYGVRTAAEPLHVQMNLPGHEVVVVNNTTDAIRGLALTTTVYAADGRVLAERANKLDAAAVSVTSPVLQLAPLLAGSDGFGFVRLELRDAGGALRSRNFYWVAADDAAMRRLDALPQVGLRLRAVRGDEGELQVEVANPSAQVALGAKLTLVDAQGERILPAYYDDNYLNLAPGEQRRLRIRVDAPPRLDGARLRLRGWNVAGAEIPVDAR